MHAYYDAAERNVVAVISSSSTPAPGLDTYATASLHASPNMLDKHDIRVELMVVAGSGTPQAANIVATSALCVMKDGWLAAPGVVFPNAVREYVADTTVPHLMWTEPFDFEGLGKMTVEGIDHEVHALQGVPLSDREHDFLVTYGFDELTNRLESSNVAHFDFHRDSVC